MIRKFSKINSPALKSFLQIFPLFVLFFVWKDFGDQIGHNIYIVFSNISAFISPAIRMAGQYILGLMVFLSLWSATVYFKIIEQKNDVKIFRFWRTIAHITTLLLTFYCIFYFIGNLQFIKGDGVSDDDKMSSIGLNIILGIIGFISIAWNFIIFNKSKSLKKYLK